MTGSPSGARERPPLDELVAGVRGGDRNCIARSITLLESTQRDDKLAGQELLAALLPSSGSAIRVGISGVPGVGKSTFIDAMGVLLTAEGQRVGVLAVDPSSARTFGSVLGDKTRMDRLAADPGAFIRPSPSAGTLGGVARATRESIVVLEAAGFDVVLVETVGVGQSEVAVSRMVDTFLLLAMSRMGDQLQGIKRGIIELADVIAVNKADGAHEAEARHAAGELSGALRILGGPGSGWRIPVLTCSALKERGLAEVWQAVLEHRSYMQAEGLLDIKRREQAVSWMWATIRDRLDSDFHADPAVRGLLGDVEAQVASGAVAPGRGAELLMRAFRPDGGRP
ncbi:MAG: methylmalonyl Co-A mutase-associated GTPase MeaB [Candidatus Nanopelagicales bacterium]|nr:methylmalonyl Co-A mutase-associated GTPase MeaB [Candidatus Nanopelagicales bacterium]MDZ4248820.1 methylmalonyl Co-A mutase-associated GTPase MeaB [Candidatus Nanopelagicales bacterium]